MEKKDQDMKENERILEVVTKKRKNIKWRIFTLGVFKISLATLGFKKVDVRLSIKWGW